MTTETETTYEDPKPTLLNAPVRAMRWLYEWVMSWADRPGGTVALGAISFAESSFFPIPPDPLMWAMCLGRQKRSFYFATVTTVGSVLGAIFGWWVGMALFQEIVDWVLGILGAQDSWYGTAASLSDAAYAGKEAIVNQSMTLYPDGLLYSAKGLFDRYGMWALAVAAFTPIPFKVATVASGFFGVGFAPLVFGSILGRGGRFYMAGLLFHFFGEWARGFLDRYFGILSIAGVILAIGGFVAFKFIL